MYHTICINACSNSIALLVEYLSTDLQTCRYFKTKVVKKLFCTILWHTVSFLVYKNYAVPKSVFISYQFHCLPLQVELTEYSKLIYINYFPLEKTEMNVKKKRADNSTFII